MSLPTNTYREASNPVSTQSAWRTALAGLVGNVLEWFDFAVYGYFANDIGKQFFPQTSHSAQQLLAFAVFAVGFFARPIGAMVLGPVGDRIGRRALLTLSIALMGGATLLLGVLPTFSQIGIIAPFLLVVLRLIQGFSLGGEFTGSMVYTTEQASPRTRGLISSSTAVGTTLGFMLGSASAWAINRALPPEIVSTWGFRIALISSVLLCAIGLLLRRGISETTEGLKAAAARPPLLKSLRADLLPMLQTFGILAMTNASYYLTFTYVAEHRRTQASSGGHVFQFANTLTLAVVLVSKPLGGWLSDKVGRRRMMIILTGALGAAIYPALRMMLNGSTSEFAIGQSLLAVPIGLALGLQGAMLVELFPLRTRVTSMSFAYSITVALTGGTAPLVSTWLIEVLGQPLAPAYYIMALGLIGLALILPMKETNGCVLDE